MISPCRNREATSVLSSEPNCVHIPEPLVIVGDTHGQFYDLCHLLDKMGKPDPLHFLFLGDYVD